MTKQLGQHSQILRSISTGLNKLSEINMRLNKYSYLDLGVLTLLAGIWLMAAATLLMGVALMSHDPYVEITGASDVLLSIVKVFGMFVLPIMLLIGTTFGAAKLTDNREKRRS